MEEVSILTIKEIAGLILKKPPHETKKISDSNVGERSIILYFMQIVK